MPYKNFKKKTKEGTQFCMTSIDTGKTYCYGSEADRAKGAKMHEIFKHMNKK